MEYDPYVQIRKHLHQNPEISGEEYQTAEYLRQYIHDNCPDATTYRIAETGVLVHFKAKAEGKVVLFRSEIDALPIEENNNFDYASKNMGVSHKCGHDGHMAILLSVADYFQKNPIESGEVFLLFQPAEETGLGAFSCLNDTEFNQICKPDLAFALHNVPGYEMGQIIVKPEAFTPAVKSIEITLKGVSAHAAQPSTGVNPSKAIEYLLNIASQLELDDETNPNFQLVTPIFIELGSRAYGTAASKAQLGFTLRTWGNEQMKKLQQLLEAAIEETSNQHHLEFSYEYLEEFGAVFNNEEAVQHIKNAAIQLGAIVEQKETPFTWGEDFGLFTQAFSGAMFCLGAGLQTPDLHHPNYDFPDELIQKGSEMFIKIWECISK